MTTVHIYPVVFHSLFLAAFGSLIGPFGGFFASGFKRAFKIKVEYCYVHMLSVGLLPVLTVVIIILKPYYLYISITLAIEFIYSLSSYRFIHQ